MAASSRSGASRGALAYSNLVNPQRATTLACVMPWSLTQTRTAMKKAAGSTKNGRSSEPKYLGMKVGDGEKVWPGRIIAKQNGYRWHPGFNVGVGKNYTLYALEHGYVRVKTGKTECRNKSRNGKKRKLIHVCNEKTAAFIQ